MQNSQKLINSLLSDIDDLADSFFELEKHIKSINHKQKEVTLDLDLLESSRLLFSRIHKKTKNLQMTEFNVEKPKQTPQIVINKKTGLPFGVSRRRQLSGVKFRAHGRINGKVTHVGYYETKEDAYYAFMDARIKRDTLTL